MDAVNMNSSFVHLIHIAGSLTHQLGALLAILGFQEMKTYAEI
jgi:hypothetical protein